MRWANKLQILTDRKETILFILVDSTGVRDYISVLNHGHRFPSKNSLVNSQSSRIYLGQPDISRYLVTNYNQTVVP